MTTEAHQATEKEIFEAVARILSEHFTTDATEITRKTHLTNDLAADSLDMVEISMEIEDALDISVPDEQVEELKTVGAIVDFAVAHRGQ